MNNLHIPNWRSRKAKLAFAYLGIIVAVSLFFSTIIYNIAVNEASRGLQRQQMELRQNLYFIRPERLEKARIDQLNSYRQRVIGKLAVINLAVLAAGAVASYYLARRNIDPLEQALESQARFTSDAAHELRTPLTAIKAETEVGLRDKHLKSSEAKTLLESNLEEVVKLEGLTNALLRLAKNGTKPNENSWQVIKVKEIVKLAVARTITQTDQAHIEIITKDVGQQLVKGDPEQLTELMVTLLENAIKYSSSKTKIIISTQTRHNQVEISVADNGIGISANDLPHIFERFYRADQSRNKKDVSGYGLGLSIAKQITEIRGGTIRVKSELGKGSVFVVSLALAS